MRTFTRIHLLFILLSAPSVPGLDARAAELTLGALFQDGMVLQREMKVPVWGWAAPGAEVSVSFAERTRRAVADGEGKWQVRLEPMKADSTPRQLTIRTSNGEQERLEGILVGDVWLCSGQSNMEWKLTQTGENYTDEMAMANHPNLRLCSARRDMFAVFPQQTLELRWRACTPETVKDFSAVAFFFGARLLSELEVPIGLIESSRGGSALEAWVPEPALREGFPEFSSKLDSFDRVRKQSGGVFDHRKNSKLYGITQRTPAVLFNAKIHPLIPYGIRGAIWYQGETNVEKPDQYRALFPVMIRQWRAAWGQGNFPFYFVQLSPLDKKSEWTARLAESQRLALSEPATGMAIINDIGDNQLHPPRKKPVGERLALLALAGEYGRQDLVCSGPLCRTSVIEQGSVVRVYFDHVGGGLASRDGKALNHFAIAGKDGVFAPAEAIIEQDTVVVRSSAVKKPVYVRFSFGEPGVPNLINSEGLPASSFRTDTFPYAHSGPVPGEMPPEAEPERVEVASDPQVPEKSGRTIAAKRRRVDAVGY